MDRNLEIVVMGSGGGSSIAELAKKVDSGKLRGVSILAGLCNRAEEDSRAGIYKRKKEGEFDFDIFHAPNDSRLLDLLNDFNPDVILCMGYVAKISNQVLSRWRNRFVNIHPTLLPRHGGKGMYDLATHMSVLESGDTITGATVHLINEKYDDGRILEQVSVPVPEHLIGNSSKENAEELQQLVLPHEYKLMGNVVGKIRDNISGFRIGGL